MLKQNLSQKMLQKLSPQQIQLIKLLELPVLELEQRIKKELEENPVLEEAHFSENENSPENASEEPSEKKDTENEFTLEDYMNDGDIPFYQLHINNRSKDDKTIEIPYSEDQSLQEHLRTQVHLKKINARQLKLADYLIGCLDSSGYLRRDLHAIVNDLAFSQNINTSEEELEDALQIVQESEPVGVGARNLQECLLLQCKKLQALNTGNLLALDLAQKILLDHFEAFSKKHYTKILTRTGITEELLKDAVELILKLNPKPGNSISASSNKNAEQITPDFILKIIDGEKYISLNTKDIPPLRISKTYRDMLQTIQESNDKPTLGEKQTLGFIKQKLDTAKWFIDAIKQRQHTLLKTINAIVRFQDSYFTHGDEKDLKPMILKDIANMTGLDISTISRVANSKYIQTHFGIFSLRYFFSEGMETTDGETVSTREIKKILSECIENEDKSSPLTDEKLAEILTEKGYKIARRTVAKYREQLGILVARLRKEL
ncbi:MAG: RNA polymerase sigma-54 factor [Bacteroidia bacterium]|nr:MAG: RNA polymerase sigma-54 factor [Bacteroidia bacterium]